MWSSWWNKNWQEKQKYSKKTSSSTTLSPQMLCDLGLYLGRLCAKPATNLLKHGTDGCDLLGSNIVQSCRRLQTFRRNVFPPGSGLKCVVWRTGSVIYMQVAKKIVTKTHGNAFFIFIVTCLYNGTNSLSYTLKHWWHRQHILPKRRYQPARLHGVTIQKIETWVWAHFTQRYI
jgi:hypothetical protein